MDPMREEVKIMRNSTVRDIAITVEDEPMKAILYQGKEDQP